jgi:flagellar M-ring protein FliF
VDFQALAAQISELLRGLTKQQKYVIFGAIAAVVLLVSGLIVYNWQTSPKGDDGYRILFDNLSPQDASLAIAQLEKDKIPYKIPRDGAIEIPADLVNKERIAIASQGIPKNSRVGFELFDKQEFGATDFDQKIKYTRALEGELSKTVEGISAVKSAVVHLAQGKESKRHSCRGATL